MKIFIALLSLCLTQTSFAEVKAPGTPVPSACSVNASAASSASEAVTATQVCVVKFEGSEDVGFSIATSDKATHIWKATKVVKDNKITETEVYVITLNYEGKMSADGKIERTESKVEGTLTLTVDRANKKAAVTGTLPGNIAINASDFKPVAVTE